MSKFGLGKGLSDLEAEAGGSPEIATLAGIPDRVVVKQIPLSQVGANPDQPRKTFSADELEDLAQSIREHGVLQPIIVRPVMGMPYLYEIIAGERRWRASSIAEKNTIPALIKPMTIESATEIALIENVQRENLNAIEECDAYKNIMKNCNYSLNDLSKLIGKSESYIRNIMRLENLPEKVKNLVKTGELSLSHARTLAVAENAEELAQRIVDEELSVIDVQKLVRLSPRSKTTKRSGRLKIGYPPELTLQAERDMEDALELKVKLSVRANGAGSLIIYFKNRTQLELLVETIKQTVN